MTLELIAILLMSHRIFNEKKGTGLGEVIEKTISASLQTTSSKDIEIELLRQQVNSLRGELKKAKFRIKELENQVNNEDEINKILNSDFVASEHNTMSFYGIQSRDVKSPAVARNVTYMKGPQHPLDIGDHPDKIQENLKYYQHKNHSLQKNYKMLKDKYQKINKRSKELYTLNEKLIGALKAQKDFEKISRDKKHITCKN